MKLNIRSCLLFAGAAWFALQPCTPVRAQDWEPPQIPVGLDAYRMWDRLPYQRIGARAYMRSTYDRRGGNETADASHFLYQKSDEFNVTLDIEGSGVLYFARYNHWHGSPWHYVVDGTDHIIKETSTADPNNPVAGSVFLPEQALPQPLTWTWSETKGANLMWVPIPFEDSFTMAYSRTHYGTGYYIYHRFLPDANLSRGIEAWDGKTPPDQDVLELIRQAGTDIAPKPDTAKGDRLSVRQMEGAVKVDPDEPALIAELNDGPSMIRALKFSLPKDRALALSRARLQITWDRRNHPSINAPLALFFGTGLFYNRDNREWLVKGFPINVRYGDDRVHLACYYPMPFFKSAKIELTGPQGHGTINDIEWEIRTAPHEGPKSDLAYFHATYRDHPEPEPRKDLVLLDTQNIEGGGPWSGHFAGSSWIFSHRAVLNTLEGDPRFFFDDSMTPQAYGTGTEEWGGGGDYWGGRNMTLPFAGHPIGAPNRDAAKDDHDLVQSAYRFLIADIMPFGRNALIRLEHGGENQSEEHYETVAYWYGAPAPSLVKTDEFNIGNRNSESAHDYHSPDASAPQEITSRYEWGVESPEFTKTGRFTKGTSEFTVNLNPDNYGVLLRRTLDYSFPNQRARVYVQNASDNAENQDWEKAGIWYLAGSNTCVYSYPREELGPTQHRVQTSDRRLRDDEFLIARRLTQGRDAIRIKVEFTPVKRPLFPGHPLPELAWSELSYDVYCYVQPKWE